MIDDIFKISQLHFLLRFTRLLFLVSSDFASLPHGTPRSGDEPESTEAESGATGPRQGPTESVVSTSVVAGMAAAIAAEPSQGEKRKRFKWAKGQKQARTRNLLKKLDTVQRERDKHLVPLRQSLYPFFIIIVRH